MMRVELVFLQIFAKFEPSTDFSRAREKRRALARLCPLRKLTRSLVVEFLVLLCRASLTDSLSKRNSSSLPIFLFIACFVKSSFPVLLFAIVYCRVGQIQKNFSKFILNVLTVFAGAKNHCQSWKYRDWTSGSSLTSVFVKNDDFFWVV